MIVVGNDIKIYPDADPRIRLFDLFKIKKPLSSGIEALVTNTPFDDPLCERMIDQLLRFAPEAWHLYLLPALWTYAKGKNGDAPLRQAILESPRFHASIALGDRLFFQPPGADGMQDKEPMQVHQVLLFRPMRIPITGSHRCSGAGRGANVVSGKHG